MKKKIVAIIALMIALVFTLGGCAGLFGETCHECNGEGKCWMCGGKGITTDSTSTSTSHSRKCPVCFADGKCPNCNGWGKV